jgi:membrane-bound ClpP family serine protease
MRLYVYLSYAIGLMLLSALAIIPMGMMQTLWFVAYLVAGVFLLNQPINRIYYFLVNSVIAVLAFIATLDLFAVIIAFVSSAGFLFSVMTLSTAKTEKKSKAAIKKIIDEVIAEKKAEPKIEVYGTEFKVEAKKESKPAKPQAKKSKPVKKK